MLINELKERSRKFLERRNNKKDNVVEKYYNKIKKKLIRNIEKTGEISCRIWIPDYIEKELETRLKKEGLDFAFLCGDNIGNIKIFVSEIVDLDKIFDKRKKAGLMK